ncbi:hypothetical protein UC34_06870 [Pandoraea vervacti]|uniref:HTH araC/xylS-type domain-containing protein n=1 Tax=Pandoraea vervacti TaxID=656178 RepID=A0ABM5T3U6_9BURK|nr:AraC family transcriptional regulator [Pandoraea vervacti]AJP59510.1 hypothetical protein UC34_06870 [Pandoraea vervacti]
MTQLRSALQKHLISELEKRGVSSDLGAFDISGPDAQGQFPKFYRAVADKLCELVSRDNGYPPMTKQEVDLMCRCMVTASTLRDAILCAKAFCVMLHPRAASLDLCEGDDAVVFTMRPVRRETSSAACILDLTGLLCFIQFFGWLIGQPLKPREIYLTHPNREDAGAFLGVFGAPVFVGAAASGFAFDAALLERKTVRQPFELESFLADLPFGFVVGPSPTTSMSQHVRALLEGAMASGDELPWIPEVARALNISGITLRRRLHAEGTSYKDIREQCLRDRAKHYLTNGSWSIDEIAGRLGFSGAAAFRRAFVGWTGEPPSRYRKR